VFPVHLVTPHAVAEDGKKSVSRRLSTGSDSPASPPRLIPPPETSGNDTSYRRLLPSSTTSITSTVSHTVSGLGQSEAGSSVPSLEPTPRMQPNSAPAAGVNGHERGAAAKSSSSRTSSKGSRATAKSKGAVANRAPKTGSAAGDSVSDGKAALEAVADLLSAEVRQQRLSTPRSDKAAPGAGAERGKADKKENAAARLSALRHKLEKNLRNAEDNHSSNVENLDRRMAGHRKSLGSESNSTGVD